MKNPFCHMVTEYYEYEGGKTPPCHIVTKYYEYEGSEDPPVSYSN